MKKLAFALSTAAAVLVTAGAASAQVYYSGPGYGVYMGPRYEEPYRRHYNRYYEDDGYNYRPRQRHYRSRSGRCPPHYTVQDGVCKPYRGY